MDSRIYTASEKYLGGAHLNGDTTLTIEEVTVEKMENDGKLKLCLHFSEADVLPLLLNKTNTRTLQELHGDETDEWLGAVITLWFDPSVEFIGRRVGGLRIKYLETEKKS